LKPQKGNTRANELCRFKIAKKVIEKYVNSIGVHLSVFDAFTRIRHGVVHGVRN
jgi:hypothetical protein